MTNLHVDERLTDGLPALLSQFPPLVTGIIDLKQGARKRSFRLAIFEAISKLSEGELTVDQITAAQLPELLALAGSLNPPFFQPANLTPSTVAREKAGSYFANYLTIQFIDRLGKVGNPPQIIAELTVDAGDFMLAQVQRLQYNFNQHFRVANYLADIKSRDGLLASIAAKQSAVLIKQGPEMVSLLGEIGQALGTVYAIKDELQRVGQSKDWFSTAVTAGRYPLPLLFAIENNADWFKQFFGQSHRPSEQLFERAYELTIAQQPATNEIINDQLKQIQLDLRVLPHGACQEALSNLVDQLRK